MKAVHDPNKKNRRKQKPKRVNNRPTLEDRREDRREERSKELEERRAARPRPRFTDKQIAAKERKKLLTESGYR